MFNVKICFLLEVISNLPLFKNFMTPNLAKELILLYKGNSILPLCMPKKYCGSSIRVLRPVTKLGVLSHNIGAITLKSNAVNVPLCDIPYSNIANVSKEKISHIKYKTSARMLHILHSSYRAQCRIRENELVDGMPQQYVPSVNGISNP